LSAANAEGHRGEEVEVETPKRILRDSEKWI
jgi:hypothetical protein